MSEKMWFFDEGRNEVYDFDLSDLTIHNGEAHIVYEEGTYVSSEPAIFDTKEEAAGYGLFYVTKECTDEIRMLSKELSTLTAKMLKYGAKI